ncbi:MAG: hypothetical protein WAW84_04975 [Candidatus Rickettsiella isopodorum]|jgi:hypothetical protein|nr:hypothetical protein [Gammaproteobacteria bacterium]MDD5161683.1 hypothetical protein [Candidatus Rickettsiella isopodorum]MDQ5899184.1 hypothetical protein [Pseudomonadota bacterium]
MPVRAQKKFSLFSNRNVNLNKHSFFFYLDCAAGEGLINLLLTELKKISNLEFEFYLKFILKKCINVNRSFSDAVEFFSIWLEKSPDSLLEKLKNAELKRYFNRTEFGHDGDKWYFPHLLHVFSTLIEKKSITATVILEYLFSTFDFFSIPEIFVTEVIGYDRLEGCIKESPTIFKQALLLKINDFVKKNETIDIGLRSFRYLNYERQFINPIKRIKTQSDKQTDRLELVAYTQTGGFFIYPEINNFNPSESSILFPRSTYR